MRVGVKSIKGSIEVDKKKKIELLAPAGDFEKLKVAVDYGADAVYIGGGDFSLRSSAGLNTDELKSAAQYVHERGKKIYMALNIYPHNEDLEEFKLFLTEIGNLDIDAFIVSDMGVIALLKEIIPDAELHLSTQANTTNKLTAKFFENLGIRRIVLARELSLNEIREIREYLRPETELEAFVHGAMCISYSGRCLLSNFMIERDANRGECAHPCRWKYALVEEQRPGEYFPIEEDGRGTYILNSRDLCMIRYIPDLVKAGVASAKIEGRIKSAFYVATIVGAYRKAIDEYYENPENYEVNPVVIDEINKASHREFTTGFYFDKPMNTAQSYQSSAYIREYSFVGVVKEYDHDTGIAVIEQRNKFSVGDEVEIFGPYTEFFTQTVHGLVNDEGEAVQDAPHPQQILKMEIDKAVAPGFLIRKRKE